MLHAAQHNQLHHEAWHPLLFAQGSWCYKTPLLVTRFDHNRDSFTQQARWTRNGVSERTFPACSFSSIPIPQSQYARTRLVSEVSVSVAVTPSLFLPTCYSRSDGVRDPHQPAICHPVVDGRRQPQDGRDTQHQNACAHLTMCVRPPTF